MTGLAILLGAALASAPLQGTWRGLEVAPETRCSPYERAKDYPYYSRTIERRIVEHHGFGMASPYSGTEFGSLRESDIEHIVATSEAHDSGLCGRNRVIRRAFARDLDNLTLAAPRLNRNEKSNKDAAEWMPSMNRCWFAETIVAVKLKYGLTVDRTEANALEAVLEDCGEAAEVLPAAMPLTAGVSGLPASHAGQSFVFRVTFSEAPAGLSFVLMRDGWSITGGRVTRASRVTRGSNRGWDIRVTPSGGSVSMNLRSAGPCGGPKAICASDGRALATVLRLVVGK